MSRLPAASFSKYELNIPKSVSHQSEDILNLLAVVGGGHLKNFIEKSTSWQMAPKAKRELKNPAASLCLLCTVGNASSVWRTSFILKFCHIWGWFPREKWKENEIPQPNLSEVLQSCRESLLQLFLIVNLCRLEGKKKKTNLDQASFLPLGRAGPWQEEGIPGGGGWKDVAKETLLAEDSCTQKQHLCGTHYQHQGTARLAQGTSANWLYSPKWPWSKYTLHQLRLGMQKCPPLPH